ncbi:MAG TPA: SRPBCC family protein [Kofleriaceae bacterium]|jgi:uncharacterized membrane protein
MSLTSKLSAALAGAGLMYFFDPDRGHPRRAKLANAAVHARKREHELVGKAVRDARHRVRGVAERVKHRDDRDIPDEVLAGRVHTGLGRAVSHPRAIELSVNDGCVLLRGDVLEREADALLAAVHGTAGVRDVIDELARHDAPDSIAVLQGEGRAMRTRDGAWTPALQVGAMGAGALLATYGVARRGLVGLAVAGAGGALLVRAIANRPLRLGDKGIVVHKTLTVNAPVEQVRDLWRRLDEFPRFLEHVRRVEVTGTRSRWTVEAFAGATATFEAELTRDEPNLVAWHTLPGQAVQHEGSVHFESVDGATRVHVELSYRPLGGVLGHAIARLLGLDPKHRMDDDLVRLKGLLEHGRARAHHRRFELAGP